MLVSIKKEFNLIHNLKYSFDYTNKNDERI